MSQPRTRNGAARLRAVPPGGPAGTSPNDPSRDARSQLTIGRSSGQPAKTIGNVLTILRLDHRWLDVLAYDAFAETPILTAQPPQRAQDKLAIEPGAAWSPQDATRTAAWIESEYGIAVPSAGVTEAVLAAAQHRKVHPVREYLDGLTWDGTARVERFFTTYCGVTEASYTHGVARMLFVGAVARVRAPGCKVDTIPILEGEQGRGKSRLIAALAAPWGADTPISLGDKDAYQSLRGVWIYELAELASFKGREAARIKSFASSPSDHYRPSYEPRARSVPRQCIFIGTTNESHYLADATGARRFWPIRVERIDVDAVKRDRDQLWAEAAMMHRDGVQWWPDHDLASQGEAEQSERYEGDPWSDPLMAWLEKPTRTRALDGGGRDEEQLDVTRGVTMAEILSEALHVPRERAGKYEQERARRILKDAGWERGPQRRERGVQARPWYPRHLVPGRSVAGDTPGDGPGDKGIQA